MSIKRPHEYPEWEVRLRPLCQKLRVLEKLRGEAHIMFTGRPAVAVRIYDMDDINRLQNDAAAASNEGGTDDDDNIDGLRHFRDSFEHSIVFFVLPSGQHQRDQLGRRDSFVNLAQKSLLCMNKAHDDNDESEPNEKKKKMTRTTIASDISQVIQTIDSMIQSLSDEKKEKRCKYFAAIAAKNFLPGSQPTQELIANHVISVLRAAAERIEMPDGDSNVVLSVMGNLANVATADAVALADMPIRDATKELLLSFFGTATANDNDTAELHVDENRAQSNNEQDEEFYDSIDDEELLECPDPRGTNYQNHQAPYPPRAQTNTIQPIMQDHQSFPVEFTPMVPSRLVEESRYSNATPSIFPDSFTTTEQNHFSQYPRNSAGYQAPQGYGYSPNDGNDMYQGHRGNGYQSFHPGRDSNMQGYEETNQDYGGGYNSYTHHSAGYHPHHQFM